ncbi:MAG: efflux RND transporter periplasmic adaptor subunit [Treponema sp.]|jgi:multidrug efflux pump subunit AcrA (membrane-fusion protein)|nr:efflux RND transporter periplasmic adaptor subunit [Treponema sp.]
MKLTVSYSDINRRRAAAVVALAILLLPAFSGCERIREAYSGNRPGGPPGAPNSQEAVIFAVNTTTAVQGQIRDYIALSGDIIAGSTVDTYSEAAGKITRVYVSVGQWVNRGAPIAAVDPSRPGMTYRVSVATAPISGTVVTLPAQVGMTISQSVPLARISGGGALEIRLYVAERFISKMAMNLPCEITLDAWPGEVFQGSISEVAPTVDPASRTMEIRVNVNNAGSRLKAGMFAKVRVITERKENIVKIPASAMLDRFGEQYVFAVDRAGTAGSVARKRVIVPGILIDGALEVQQGLSPNEEIIVRGQTLLEDGSRVNIIEQLAPLAAN